MSLERRLPRRVAARMVADPNTSDIAESRLKSYWAEQDTELQAEWALVWQAGQLLARASEIDKALQKRTFTWTEIVERYTGEANWAELDTLHRRLERRASSLEFALATPASESGSARPCRTGGVIRTYPEHSQSSSFARGVPRALQSAATSGRQI